VIEVLEEAGIHIDCVAGTSIGALVGAAYASGKISSLERVVRELDWKGAVALFDVGLPRSGLFDGRKVTDSIREHVESGDIRDLPLPYCAVSTNLVDGSEVHIRSGDVIEAVRASISIPGVFTPVKRDEMLLVDGGLVNPVPSGVVRKMGADYVVAVDLNHGVAGVSGGDAGQRSATARQSDLNREKAALGAGKGTSRLGPQMAALKEKMSPLSLPRLSQARQWFSRESMPNILEVLISSINIMEAQITEMQLQKDPPDLLIRPMLGHIDPMEFHRGAEVIAEGQRAARASLDGVNVSILASKAP
jgi:NTE family protein